MPLHDVWTFLFGLVGALAVLVPPMLWLGRRIRALSVFSDPRLLTFLDDWCGEEARPGFPARPGVPERLAMVEVRTEQLQRNGGASLRDSVDRLVRDADTRGERLARIEGLLSAQAAAGVTVVGTVAGPPDRAG